MCPVDIFKRKPAVLSPQDAMKMMEGSEKYVLLDVRAQAEYDEERLPGATLIPLDELGVRAADELPGKDIPILIY